MQRSVRPSTPEDGPKIATLMREAGLYPPVDPQHLLWKYWVEREDWPGSRSYVLTDGAQLLAHLAVIPTRCHLDSGTVKIASVVDWVARPHEVGAGARLMKYVGSLTDALLAIHGSAAACKVMRLIGYQPHGFVTGYVRSLFPLRLLRQPAGPRWRLLPRLARSTLWSLAAPGPAHEGWEARPITAEQIDSITCVLPRTRHRLAVLERSRPQLRYMLDCPTVPMKLYTFEREGHVRGYFVLGFAPGQARLVDCWTESIDPADWRAMIQCAVTEAKRDNNVAELGAWANDPLLARCLVECGFHARFTAPIYLRANSDSVIGTVALRVQMVDSDLAYLHGGRGDLWA